TRPPPPSPFFPYTTLFRSLARLRGAERARRPLPLAGLLQRVRGQPQQARVATTPRSTLGIPLLPRCRRRSIRETGGGRHRFLGRSEEHTSELQSPYDLVCR